MEALEIWFVTGSQHLYGPETLKQVALDSQEIVRNLVASSEIPLKVVFKPVLTDPAAVRQLFVESNSAKNCVGLLLWMHTFSPAKMWIGASQWRRNRSCICIRSSIEICRGLISTWTS